MIAEAIWFVFGGVVGFAAAGMWFRDAVAKANDECQDALKIHEQSRRNYEETQRLLRVVDEMRRGVARP